MLNFEITPSLLSRLKSLFLMQYISISVLFSSHLLITFFFQLFDKRVGFQNSMGLAFSLYGMNGLPIKYYSLFDLLQHANNKIIWIRFFAFNLHPFVFNVFILLHHSLYIFTMPGAPYLQLKILLDLKKYNSHKSQTAVSFQQN